VPELELREAAHEGLELVGRLCGEVTTTALLHVLGGLKTGVELGRDEGEEKIQEVDAERVCDCEHKVSEKLMAEDNTWDEHTDIPALSEEDAQAEHQEDDTSSNPAVCLVRR
jgi:hypothetical protein